MKYSNSLPTKRFTDWQGLPVRIEIDKGDTKSGIDETGESWSHLYSVPYGEFPNTTALADGDGVDLYLGPQSASEMVYVVHQLKRDGSFDEDKCMLQFADKGSAIKAYRDHGPAWGLLDDSQVDEMTVDQFVNGYLASNRKL